MPTKQCGHTDDKEGDDCSLCKTITKTLSKDSPPKILKKILSVRTFAVFIFYHGSECNGCNAYFDALATHVKDFRTMGGDVFAVTTLERKEALHTERLWHSSIGVISDPKIVLAKKFAITVPKTKVHHGLQAKKSFFQKLKLATSKDSQPPYSSSFSGDEGMVTHREQVSDSPDSQPTFLIVKNDEEVIYSWTGAQSPNAPLSVTDPNQIMKTRVTPQDLSSIVRFYFQATTIPLSIKQYVKNNSESVFELMLSHEESKKLLVEYLKKEFCSESLEFVEDVEELEDKLDDMTTQRLLGIIMMIFHTYISDNAPKEVNLPSEIKRSLVQKFRRTKSMGDLEIPLEQRIEDVELTKVENGQHIFSSAYIHVKLTMRENSFMRLINSKEFMSACSKSIPKCFVSQIPYAQPTVCKGV